MIPSPLQDHIKSWEGGWGVQAAKFSDTILSLEGLFLEFQKAPGVPEEDPAVCLDFTVAFN